MEHHPKNVAQPPERIRSHARQGHRRFGTSRFIVASPQGPPLEAKVNEKKCAEAHLSTLFSIGLESAASMALGRILSFSGFICRLFGFQFLLEEVDEFAHA